MAPIRELQLLWGSLMTGRLESRYCTNCMRTTPFRRTHHLVCLTCGKRLAVKRRR